MNLSHLLRRCLTCRSAALAAVALLAALAAPASAQAVTQPSDAEPTLALPVEAAPAAPLPTPDFSLTIDPSLLAAANPDAAPVEPVIKAAAPEAPAAAWQKGPPLPLHTTEGQAGALFVPFAYMINPGPPGTIISPPAASYTFVKVGKKFINQFVVTDTILRRIEVGYLAGILHLSDFPGAVRTRTGVDIDHDDVVLHVFSLRGMVIEESEYIPAVTAGAAFKYNPTVQSIDTRLNGGVRGLGLERSNGVDYTLTATKTIPNVLFGRPIMLTGGVRFSQAAQLGYLGFGDAYRMTLEADVCVPVTNWLAMSYEWRQKKNPYGKLGDLVGEEDDWHAICAAIILSDRLTLGIAWGNFGTMVNHDEIGVWGFQIKYEF